MPEIIARRELIAVSSSGKRFPVTIELGKPISTSGRNENWECHLSITPPLMHRPMNVRGYDALQALCLATSLPYFLLLEFFGYAGHLPSRRYTLDFVLDDPFLELGRKGSR